MSHKFYYDFYAAAVTQGDILLLICLLNEAAYEKVGISELVATDRLFGLPEQDFEANDVRATVASSKISCCKKET
ncbi:MAG: hypothetical protein ABI270_06260 [Nitrosospira sp.]